MVSGGEKAPNIPLFVKYTAFCVVMQHLCFILKVMVIFNKSAIMSSDICMCCLISSIVAHLHYKTLQETPAIAQVVLI